METVLRRDELRQESLSPKAKASQIYLGPAELILLLLLVPYQYIHLRPPKHSGSWPSSSTGSRRLRTRLRSNFPKGLRLISSHTGTERERGEWEQGRVASGEELPGAPRHPTDRQSGSQAALTAWVL